MLTISKNGQAMTLSESDVYDMLKAFEYAFTDNTDKPQRTFGCVKIEATFSGKPASPLHQMTDKKRLTDC
jgi:hypothetical protein